MYDRNRVKVKEPPRNGRRDAARFWLRDGPWEVIGWTDDAQEADEWLGGFGPVTTSHIEDRRAWVKT
jgi:hypothetical protein